MSQPEPAFLKLLSRIRQPETMKHADPTRAEWVTLLSTGLLGAATLGAACALYGLSGAQVLSSMLKLPLVLFATMGICFPTFFLVQYALSPTPLGLRAALLLQLTSVSIIALTWSVLALPLAVLLASSGSYVLVKVLVSAVAALGGMVGASFFSRAFRVLAADEKGEARPWALLPYFLVFGLVGSQISWNLRPFIGSPSQGFILFRELGGSLLEHFLGIL